MNGLDAQKNIDRNAQFHLMELTAPITETLLELMFDDFLSKTRIRKVNDFENEIYNRNFHVFIFDLFM